MNRQLLDILVCPRCKDALSFEGIGGEHIESGVLRCSTCHGEFPIVNGIPRFVDHSNYASSFGYQWNRFRKEQIDSFNGTTLSSDRFWSETEARPEDLADKLILDAGCGAGRFLDVAAASQGQIVGVDMSSAIDAARDNVGNRSNVHFVQASIYDLPFREGTFDLCYCIGVLQHTPKPAEALRTIALMVKKEGKLAVTIYPRKFYTKLYSKYWIRPITKRVSKERLLKLVSSIMPVAFPLTNFLFRIPFLGRVFMFAIPVANYVHEKQLSKKQRYDWAILDTFDMLSPFYDQPMKESEALEVLRESSIAARRTKMNGLNIVGRKL